MNPDAKRQIVWLDLCNAPHVLFFSPIMAKLRERGIETFVTAQDFGQTLPLLKQHKMSHIVVGGQAGKSLLAKGMVTLARACRLATIARARRSDLLVSHGSRSAVLAASLVGVPSMTIDDYEYSFTRINNALSRTLLFPSVIPRETLERLGYPIHKLRFYPGFKEEVYLSNASSETRVHFTRLGIDAANNVIVLLRPPATTAHYHTELSDQLFSKVIDLLKSQKDTQTIVLGRNQKQQVLLRNDLKDSQQFIVADEAFDGVALLNSVDVMIGGGGTMNREAALLGVRTYSFFGGERPAVDLELEKRGLMKYLASETDVRSITLSKRQMSSKAYRPSVAGLEFIVDAIVSEIQ